MLLCKISLDDSAARIWEKDHATIGGLYPHATVVGWWLHFWSTTMGRLIHHGKRLHGAACCTGAPGRYRTWSQGRPPTLTYYLLWHANIRRVQIKDGSQSLQNDPVNKIQQNSIIVSISGKIIYIYIYGICASHNESHSAIITPQFVCLRVFVLNKIRIPVSFLFFRGC